MRMNHGIPNFIGIGAQRCGTTWLDAQLRKHPQAYLPTRRKEVHYFDQYFDRGPEWYQAFFPEQEVRDTHVAIGEITPKYLFDPLVAERIHRYRPEAKLIVILRNPVDRAYSQYGLSIVKSGRGGGFAKFLQENPEAFERGLYHDQLERYFKLFSRERILILFFEEVMADQAQALVRVCNFLGIDPSSIAQADIGERVGGSHQPRFATARKIVSNLGNSLRDRDMDWVINIAKRVGVLKLLGNRGRVASIDPKLRSELLLRYGDEIRRLESLLGRDLGIWTRPHANADRLAS